MHDAACFFDSCLEKAVRISCMPQRCGAAEKKSCCLGDDGGDNSTGCNNGLLPPDDLTEGTGFRRLSGYVTE